MSIVAHTYPFVIGVDTHARTHTFAVVRTGTGELLATETFPSTPAGMTRAVSWVARRTDGDLAALWAIEGIGSYGAQLARTASRAGYQAVEAGRMDARAQQHTGKSDPLDAQRIAMSVLTLDSSQLRHPRADDGIRAALRILITAREHMASERTAAVNALTALLRIIDLGLDARRRLTSTQIQQVAAWRTRSEEIALTTARTEAIRLARRIRTLDQELAENHTQLKTLVEKSHARELLTKTGIGPVTAAVVYTAWSHHGRVRNEAAFAALAGVNPIPASSGNTTRHRLNRSGDRRLNKALHTTALVRMAYDPETRAYVERRRAEGRTTKEIRRCLKRYLARHIYRTLNAQPATT